MGLIRTFDGQTNVFLGSVGLGATPNERLTVNGSISANNTIFGKSISSGNYLGTWSGDPLSSDQVVVESIDLKTTNISGGLILAADGKGGVEFVENTGVSNINNIEGNLTVTGYISAGGNLSASTINAATSFISGGIDLFDIFGAGGCSGGIGGAGTINKIPKFTTSSCIGDSLISELGTTITVNGNLSAKCNLNIDGNSTILGNLSVHGDMHYIDTKVTVTSALSVVNTGTGPALFVRQDGTQPIAHFIDKNGDDVVIDDNGRVGIGTYSPQKALEISAAGTSGGGVMRLASTGETSAGNAAGSIQFYNGDTTDHTPGVFGIIRGVAGPSGGEGHLQFLTDMPSEGADACVVAMQIHSNANVGIGTTSPTEKLSIYGNLTATGSLSAACNISLLDNGKLTLGNSCDLQIYHDGGNSIIKDNGTGALFLLADASTNISTPGGEAQAKFTKDGSVDLYYNGTKRFETTDTGVDVTGTITSDGHTIAGNLSSNGTGIFKSLSAENSSCTNYFAGKVGISTTSPSTCLEIDGGTGVDSSGGTIVIRQKGNTFNDGISITSSHANSHRIWKDSDSTLYIGSTVDPDAFAQTLAGKVGIGTTSPACKLTVAGTVSACGGFRVADLEIQRSASENYISSSSELRINSDVTRILKNNLGEYMANFYGDAAVELYYNGTKRFETTNTGAKITGSICATNDANFDGDLTVRDAFVRNLSATHSICTAATTNGFVSAGRDLADIFSTTSSSVDGSGTAGKLPVWSDSNTLGDSPISSISNGISIGSNGLNITTGSTVDKIQSDASFLVLEGDNVILRKCGGSEDYGKFQADGAVLLYHNNVQKFETTSGGATVTGGIKLSDNNYLSWTGSNTRMIGNSDYLQFQVAGSDKVRIQSNGNVGIGTITPGQRLSVQGNISASGSLSARSGYSYLGDRVGIGCNIIPGYGLSMPDNCVIGLGNSGDLQIYHDGNNWIDANGVGDLYLRNLNSSGDVIVQAGASADTYIKVNSGETALKATNNGAVEIYYDDSKKLETINTGVCVTGHVCASGNGYFSCVIAGGYFEEKAANPSLAGYPTGTIVSIGENGDLTKSTVMNDRKVFGVTQNGACQPIVLGAEPVLVAGDIKIGDYITTSSKPGHGMKATCTLHGAVIAQAMEAGCGDSYLVKAMIRKM